MKSPGGVANQELDIAPVGRLVGFVTKRRRIGVVLTTDHFDFQALRPDRELLDRRCAEGVGGREQDGVAVALKVISELGG